MKGVGLMILVLGAAYGVQQVIDHLKAIQRRLDQIAQRLDRDHPPI